MEGGLTAETGNYLYLLLMTHSVERRSVCIQDLWSLGPPVLVMTHLRPPGCRNMIGMQLEDRRLHNAALEVR